MDDKSRQSSRERIVVIFALTILVVWTIVTLASIYTQDYTGLTIVTPALLLAAGAVFGIRIKRNGNGNGD